MFFSAAYPFESQVKLRTLDKLFDGFAGVGTTAKVAKDGGRKFIGIEQDHSYFEAMQRRLAE